MTNLDCSVVNCMYNEANSCCRTGITVEGESAHVPSETSCGSFQPRKCGCATNSVTEPRKETEISCHAYECMYNRSKYCHAPHIAIAGGHADKSNETECESFVMS